MSQKTPPPDIPKPNIPKPNIPKPNIPKPNVPAPNLDRQSAAPPASAVEMGAMEQPIQNQAAEEESSPAVEYTDSILPQRLVAGLIDFGVAGCLLWISSLVLPSFLDNVPIALALAYLLLKDSLPFLDGQSVGKKVMKIRAVTNEGVPLTNNYGTGALRNVFAAIPILALVEIFILHTREKEPNAGLRLGDDFAKTKVIRTAPEAAATLEESENSDLT